MDSIAWYREPMRLVAEHPRDAFAIAAALCAVAAIGANALFLQTARHPAPLFSSSVIRLNPAPADQVMPPAPSRALPRALPQPAPRPAAAAPVPSAASAPVKDPLAELIAADRRIVAVQKALSEFGYGQIDADGVLGPATRAAIEKFEREQKLPVTGQISDRLVRDLSAITGRPIK